MADAARAPVLPRRGRKRMRDLTYLPGFNQIAWICIFVLYAPILAISHLGHIKLSHSFRTGR